MLLLFLYKILLDPGDRPVDATETAAIVCFMLSEYIYVCVCVCTSSFFKKASFSIFIAN